MDDRAIVALERIADALEKSYEIQRQAFEITIDSAASTNALTDQVQGMVSKLLGGDDE